MSRMTPHPKHHVERSHATARRLLAGLAAVALAVAVTPATAGARPQTPFRLAVHFGADPFIDTGAPGPSLGDLRVLDDGLYRGRRQVGRDGGSCVITNMDRPEASCTVTWRLPRGTITGQWLNQPPPRKVVAVTGGTGLYRRARGEAVVVERSTDRGFVTFHLAGRRNHL
jgi:hypothetical protein